MKNIGFIGMGNMASALLRGFCDSGAADCYRFMAFDLCESKLAQMKEEVGLTPAASAEELIAACDTVIIAVKPNAVEALISAQRDALRGKALISIALGWDYARYDALLDKSTRHLFVMPNTPAAVRKGVFLFEETNSLSAEELSATKALFASVGEVITLPSSLMEVGGAVSGCGPAFVAMSIEALADAAVLYGIPRATAYRLASQTFLGTAALQLQTESHPAAIKDAVCSPGGSTIRGVAALEYAGLRAAWLDAVTAVMEREK